MLQHYIIFLLSVCDIPPNIVNILESASVIPHSKTIKKSHASRPYAASYPSRRPCRLLFILAESPGIQWSLHPILQITLVANLCFARNVWGAQKSHGCVQSVH